MSRWVAITGCNGYIGGQTAIHFRDLGFQVLGCDRNELLPWLRDVVSVFVQSDFTGEIFLNTIRDLECEAVIHIAGTSLVGPSVLDPGIYYHNNVGETAMLMRGLYMRGWEGPVVYSSSAATYGNPMSTVPLKEEQAGHPCSPYGWSKWMSEQVLEDCARAYGLSPVGLRYFNACGADTGARHGQVKNATHIIARVMESLINDQTFTLNGQDFATPDGTCVRDYVHVVDLAQAHADAIAVALPGRFQAFNLGTGQGYSNREIIDMAQQVTGQTLNINVGPKREGDPAVLVADSSRFQRITPWRPKHSGLENIIESSWRWYNSSRYHSL
jgi:UDP-glucose 4-epimerase